MHIPPAASVSIRHQYGSPGEYPVHPPEGICHFPTGVVCLIKQEDTGAEAVRITRASGTEFDIEITSKKLTQAQRRDFPVRVLLLEEQDAAAEPDFAPKTVAAVKTEERIDLERTSSLRVTVQDGEVLKVGNTITYAAGSNIITLDDSAGAGDSWGTAYDMDDVLANAGAVVTKQGANAYDVSARMHFMGGVYFVSASEFVELKPNPINPLYTIRAEVGSHLRFGEYDVNNISKNGAFWQIYLQSTTGDQRTTGNRIMGEFLVYGSNIICDSTAYQRGPHFAAGATIRLYSSICRWSGYFWAPNCNMQDVKFHGGGGQYDMLFATGYDYSFSGVTAINCNYGLFFSSTTDAPVDVYNQKFQHCTYDIGLISTSHLIRVINSPFATYHTLGNNRSFKECYEFNVKVTDDQGSSIVGATVSLKDVDGADAFTPVQTIAGGVLPADEVVVVKWFRHANQGGNKDYNDHTLKVTNGPDETEYKIKIDHKMSEDVVLLPQSVASYDNIMEGINDIKGTGFVKDTDSLTDIQDDVTGLNGAAMRGTNGAYTGTPPTVGAIRTEMETPGGTLAVVAADVAGLGGEAMRGTDGAPTAGAIRTEMETPGGTLAVAAADVGGLGGEAMRGTDGANTATPPTVGQIRTEVETPGGSLALVKDKTDLIPVDFEAILARLLGYAQENFRLRDQAYDVHGRLTSATIRIYGSAVDCLADVAHIAQCAVAATYAADGTCSSYTVTR